MGRTLLNLKLKFNEKKCFGIYLVFYTIANLNPIHSKCRSNAIRDLSAQSLLTFLANQCELKDYGRMLDFLETMGTSMV